MNFEHGDDPQGVCAHESIEARVLPPPGDWNPTAQFFGALYTLASVLVALPVSVAMSVALAVALYIRCAAVLLSTE